MKKMIILLEVLKIRHYNERMKWLLITDDDSLFDIVSGSLAKIDKKNKLLQCDFSAEALKKQKNRFSEYIGCVIYSEREGQFSRDDVALISSITGFLAFQRIPVITNLELILGNPIFAKDIGVRISGKNDLPAVFDKKCGKIISDSVARIARNRLLDRGIPFTSDCFGTYIAKNKLEIVNEFLEAGMSVNARDDTGTPMLNIACRNDNFEFVEMLLELGAELNAISEDRGYTAVMDAVWRGNEKITRFLIAKGAELNTINKEGQTNLILAVGANRESLVELLAENGADPDVKDMMGMSAYTYATLFKKARLVDILQKYHKE